MRVGIGFMRPEIRGFHSLQAAVRRLRDRCRLPSRQHLNKMQPALIPGRPQTQPQLPFFAPALNRRLITAGDFPSEPL